MSGAPVVPSAFLHGVDIGDLRVARGQTRHAHSVCKHLRLVFDDTERRVWCEDCESEVEAFDASTLLVTRHDHLAKKADELRELQSLTLVSRAAKKLNEAFRSKKGVPCCPHCDQALFPEDVAGGLAMKSKELERQRRESAQKGGKR